ncbi:MAG: fatty acid desaturase [Verrucomicrobiaceae bacterium]|nr:MAG: fatty acid desaturase [Verrucomicrobiaceae bacterium]
MNSTVAPPEIPTNSAANWKKLVAGYRKPSTPKASLQIINTILAYIVTWIVMYHALTISWWLVVPLIVLGGGLLIRVFIIFHDCGHGSFFKSRKANDILGFVCGILTFTPYMHWRWEHAIHHASSGDLDRRGVGDIWTMTLAEYIAAPKRTQVLYRIARNPIVMFLIAPVLMLVVYQRFPDRNAKPREKRSVWLMNLAILVIYSGVAWWFGVWNFLIIQAAISMIGGGAGVWLFYVQHQFEDVVWERKEGWEFAVAAMEGSSYYKLPRILQWFSGNIGFHHIHHLSPQIPNYHLQACHESHPFFDSVPPVTLWQSLKTIHLKLWDEENRRLVGFPAVHEIEAMRTQSRSHPHQGSVLDA